MLTLSTFFNLALVLVAMFTNSFVFNLIDKIQGAPVIGNEGNVIVINKTNNQIIQRNQTEGFWDYPPTLCKVWDQYIDDIVNRTVRISYESIYKSSECDYHSYNMNVLESYGSMMNFKWVYIAFSIIIFLTTLIIDLQLYFNLEIKSLHKNDSMAKSVLKILTVFYIISLCLVLYNIGNIMNNLIHDVNSYDNPFKNNILNFYACILSGLFCNTFIFMTLVFFKIFK
jgi:hypothetical protein